jgi:hypothetical protein
MLGVSSRVLEGKAMGVSLPQATALVRQTGRLNRWLPAFVFATPAETPADPAILLNWRAESREIRSQASTMAERPPLPSY